MNMDETPDNLAGSSLPASEKKKSQPQTQSAYSLGMGSAAVIGTLILGLAGLGIYSYQHLHSPIPPRAPISELTPNNHWQDVDAQLQELRQAQQQLIAKNQQHQQKIQEILQEQHAQSQDWDLQKARYYLELAQINAQWSHNITATLSLLHYADQLLSQHSNDDSKPIRQAITQDIATLEQMAPIDTTVILDKLAALIQQVEQLSARPLPIHSATPSKSTLNQTSTWRDNFQENIQQLRGLISIHHQDEAWLAPFNRDSLGLLREHIRMNFQQAEIGLIEQHQALYSLALRNAANSIEVGFNLNDPKTQALIHELQILQSTVVAHPTVTLHPYAQLFEHTGSVPSSDLTSDTKAPL